MQMCKLTLFFILITFNLQSQDLKIIEAMQKHIAKISEEIRDSVVHVKVEAKRNNKKYDSFGSGFVLDKNGYIFTNHHVIDKATKVIIKFNRDPFDYKARVVGSDRSTDVALLKVIVKDKKKLRPVKMGSAKAIKVGQWVLAVGNPYGFDRTVSFGIVSAKGRNIPRAPVLNEFIQTDAMIAPGSSGGPLLNLRGEVIGINSRASRNGGIGFTIPIEVALDVKEKIGKEGTIKRGWLGLKLQPLKVDLRDKLNIAKDKGIIISYVSKESGAFGKVKPLDILLTVNGKKMFALESKDLTKIKRRLARFKVGSYAKLEIIDALSKKRRVVMVKVKSRPPKEGRRFESDMGFTLKEITENIFDRYMLKLNHGIYISYVQSGSSAKQAHLFVGDIVLEIDQKPIKSIMDVKSVLKGGKKEILLKLLRGRDFVYALVKK